MIVSKSTSKAQTTIPQPVRAALRLQPGDEIVYEIVDDRVIVTKARSRDRADDPFRAFAEWSSEADARAHSDL
jgi:antitoxin PrlF